MALLSAFDNRRGQQKFLTCFRRSARTSAGTPSLCSAGINPRRLASGRAHHLFLLAEKLSYAMRLAFLAKS
jgi:hypothetical protein